MGADGAALRRSAGQGPEGHLSRLAAALRTEALSRAEVGDRAGALLAGVEAVAAYAGILHPPGGHDVALAELLEAMAHWYTEDGLDDAAAATAGDAVAVYLGLDEEEPGRRWHGRCPSIRRRCGGSGRTRTPFSPRWKRWTCSATLTHRAGPSPKPSATTPDSPGSSVGSRKPRRTGAQSSTSSPATPTAAS